MALETTQRNHVVSQLYTELTMWFPESICLCFQRKLCVNVSDPKAPLKSLFWQLFAFSFTAINSMKYY